MYINLKRRYVIGKRHDAGNAHAWTVEQSRDQFAVSGKFAVLFRRSVCVDVVSFALEQEKMADTTETKWVFSVLPLVFLGWVSSSVSTLKSDELRQRLTINFFVFRTVEETTKAEETKPEETPKEAEAEVQKEETKEVEGDKEEENADKAEEAEETKKVENGDAVTESNGKTEEQGGMYCSLLIVVWHILSVFQF